MIDRRGFFSLSLKAAAVTLVCAVAAQAAAEQGVAEQGVAGQAVAERVAPEQAAAPNHPRREARRSSPLAAQEAPVGRADAAPQARSGSSSSISVADNDAVRSHRRSRPPHAASRGQGDVAIAASVD